MEIYVGSLNPVKIAAVKEVVKEYHLLFNNATVRGIKVDSEVRNQPMTQGDTIQGAINRARNAMRQAKDEEIDCEYSLGLESGLSHISGIYGPPKFLEFTACAISYDKAKIALGTSPAFELPSGVVKRIFNGSVDISKACFSEGLTKDKNVGSSKGLIGILTDGQITRKDYTKLAIEVALIQLKKPNLYL